MIPGNYGKSHIKHSTGLLKLNSHLISQASHLLSSLLHFPNIIKAISEQFTSINTAFYPQPSSIPPSFDAFKPVSDDDTHNLILSSLTKSCLIDPWPTFLVKECIYIFLPSSYYQAFQRVMFLLGLKKLLSPLTHKKASLPVDDQCQVSASYQSLWNEWWLNNFVNTHMFIISTIPTNLNTIKAGHSTETALLLIKNNVHISVAKGELIALVLLDLSAAFDTIDHSTLFNCL